MLQPLIACELPARPLRDAAPRGAPRGAPGQGPTTIPWCAEVPLPLEGDRGAWAAVLMHGEVWIGVEAKSRVRDAQAVQRRIDVKRRDDPRIGRVILLPAASVSNREAAIALRSSFPPGTRETLASLGRGDAPPLDAIAVLRPQVVHTGGKLVDAAAHSPSRLVDKSVGLPDRHP